MSSREVMEHGMVRPEVSEELMTYRDALQTTMRAALDRNDTIIIGQGVDDHKGTFGTTLGLADQYGADRVMDVPLAEEATTGIALGASLNGLYPIHIHIRNDFALLAMNQIINLVAKYRYMYGGRFNVPMLIRMVIGRSWGQGAQHSQSLQALFGHIPGLAVVMPATPQAVLKTYPWAIESHPGPVISLEHRLLYDLAFQHNDAYEDGDASPLTSYRVREGSDVTIVATSIMALEARRAAEHLEKVAGIGCEVIDLHSISHPNRSLILDSVKRTGRLVIADTSWRAYGVTAEVCRLVCEESPMSLKAPVVSLAMAPAPCPTAKSLEDLFYPNLETMVDSIARLVTGNPKHGIPVPHEHSMADVYKRFKGPF